MTMTNNMSNFDRAVRLAAGIVLLIFANGLYDAGNSPASNVWWAWIGIVPLATAFIGWCPLYSALGISTWKA
jgi:hypothetical protein